MSEFVHSKQVHVLFCYMSWVLYTCLQRFASQVPDPLKDWPMGLRDGINELEETKTAHLHRVVCLGIGLPVVLSKPGGEYVALGVRNNSDGESSVQRPCSIKIYFTWMD